MVLAHCAKGPRASARYNACMRTVLSFIIPLVFLAGMIVVGVKLYNAAQAHDATTASYSETP